MKWDLWCLEHLGKCCWGPTPPANHRWIFPSRPDLCGKWNTPSFHLIMKAFPKILATECPPCWQGQQTCVLPVAQNPGEIWAAVASGADGEAKQQPPFGDGRSTPAREPAALSGLYRFRVNIFLVLWSMRFCIFNVSICQYFNAVMFFIYAV